MMKPYSQADGLTTPGRPHSASNRARADAGPGNMKVYSNNLYDGGDILAAEAQQASVAMSYQTPASPPAVLPGGSQKFQQQRAMAAQKRLERLQMGGIAQNSDSIAVVTLSSNQPGTGAASKLPAAPTAALSSYASWQAGNSTTAATSDARAGVSSSMCAAEKALLAQGQKTVYDPNDDIEVETLEDDRKVAVRPNASSKSLLRPVPAARLDLSDIVSFLTRPGPKEGPVLCFIEREKGGMGKPPGYRLYLEDNRRFLLAARKRKKSTSSNYVISSSSTDLSRRSSSCIGKLKSNFVGTEFGIYCKAGISSNASGQGQVNPAHSGSAGTQAPQQADRSSNSSSKPGAVPDSKAVKQDVGAVLYQYNVLGTRGPRKMIAAVPSVTGAGSSRWRPSGADNSILERLKSGSTSDLITVLKNKTPKWNESLNAYCLNFSGRVTEASVKNFQLVTEQDPETVVLQFGKVSDSCFTCDLMWPLSPLQAFCICLSSFDNKLACE